MFTRLDLVRHRQTVSIELEQAPALGGLSGWLMGTAASEPHLASAWHRQEQRERLSARAQMRHLAAPGMLAFTPQTKIGVKKKEKIIKKKAKLRMVISYFVFVFHSRITV